MTGDERLAKVAEVLAPLCDHCNGHGFTVQGWTDKGGEPEEQFGPCMMCRRRAKALIPLLDEFRAEDEARALREVRRLADGPASGGYRPYAVEIDGEVHLAVLLDDLRAALGAAETDAGER